MTCTIWDEKRNLYDFIQDGENIFVKKDGNIIFKSKLQKIKEIDTMARRPIILKNELFIKDYWKSGYERHKLDGSECKFSDNWADYVILLTNNNALLPIESTWQIWDENKNFYEFNQIDEKISLTKDDKIFFESKLLKKLKAGSPNIPMIIKDELYVFDYDKGFEIHKLDGSDRKFFTTRSSQQVVYAGELLFFKHIKKLTTFNLTEKTVTEEKDAAETFWIHKCSHEYLLFYRYRHLKSFLYNIKTKEFIELPKFTNKIEILKTIMKDNKLIAFYFSGRQPNKPASGVYVYNLDQKAGSFYCELFERSPDCPSCGAEYSDLIDFSFNTLKDEDKLIDHLGDYAKYLYFVLKKFGFYAFLRYVDVEEVKNFRYNSKEIGKICEYYRKKLLKLPKSKDEFDLLLKGMIDTEEKLSKLLSGDIIHV